MKQLFKPQTFRQIIFILGILAGVKLAWTIVEVIWLPASGVEYQENKKSKNLYYRVSFVSTDRAAATVNQVRQVQGSIRDIKLVAVYSSAQRAVVAIEHRGKITVLASGDNINGFVLESAGIDFATFLKEEKAYRVDLEKKGSPTSGSGTILPSRKPAANSQASGPQGDVTDAGDRKLIDRSLITHYATNMDAIFKDIGISDIKENGKVKGFKVSFIRKGSYFSQLGLQRGDVIKAVNGQEINNYNAALGIYNDIQNIDNLTLVIERDNKEMELEYEVN